MRLVFLNAGLCLMLLLCQCGAPQAPQCRHLPLASRTPAATLADQARVAWRVMARSARPSDVAAARASYNDAVAKLFDQLRCGSGDWNARATTLGTCIAPPDARHVDVTKLDALFPASLVGTRKVGDRRLTDGLGLPLVGWVKTTPIGMPRPQFFLPTGLPYMATATLDFSAPGLPVWRFVKRWLHEDIAVGSHRETLAADWSAANAFYWHMSDLDDLRLQNVLLPERFQRENGLYFLQPYDPEKIPVILVHGIAASPDAFRRLINDLAPEPWFRQRYQVWLYNYPTGNPWLYSAMHFRRLMHEACAYARTKGGDTKLNQMVVIAHSMGGLITRASVTPAGTAIYDAHYPVPPDQLKVNAATRDQIKEMMLYEPLHGIRRVVFMAVPHQGSPVANFTLANMVSKLIKLPKRLTVDLLDATVRQVANGVPGAPRSMPATSINSLSPRSPAITGLNRLPLPDGIMFHSIIGDRLGSGLTSSDGVVPYPSAHVDGVASEKLVNSLHSVQNHPDAAAEIKRILRQHPGPARSHPQPDRGRRPR